MPDDTSAVKPHKTGAPSQELSQKFAIQLNKDDWPVIKRLAIRRDRSLARTIRDLVHLGLKFWTPEND